MAEFEQLLATGEVNAEFVNAVQQNIAKVITELTQDIQTGIQVTPLTGTDTGLTYTASTSNKYIICDTVTGPITIVLPVREQEQVLTVKNKRGTRTIAIKIADGSSTSDGHSTVEVMSYQSVTMICDGSSWMEG